MILSFAPMEGVTGASYRRIHSEMFPGADRYYAPFIAPDSQGNFRLKHLRDVLPDNNQGISLVPQILANSPEAFLSVAGQLRELGFQTAAMALREDSLSVDDPALHRAERLAVVLGTEGDGLRDGTIAGCDYTVRIPMSHGVDSLNVAAASAVAFWELRAR